MFLSYLRISWRIIRKNRIHSVLNIAAGTVSLALALLTVGFKALHVAAANPVDALRYE